MRTKILALLGGLGLGLCATSGNAAPVIPPLHSPEASGIISVAEGCGHGMYRNYHGYCVWRHPPHEYHGYYGHHYGAYPYHGRGYEAWNHQSWGDHSANHLNAQEAHRGWGYWGH